MRFIVTIVAAVGLLLMTPDARAGGGGPGDGNCVGDVDGDGLTGFSDILAIIGAWGPCAPGCAEDLNGNGQADFADILIVIGDYNCGLVQQSTLSGVVSNLWDAAPVEGATVTVGATVLTTDVDGRYSDTFEPGLYTVTVEDSLFESFEGSVVVFPDLSVEYDVELTPIAAVVVTVVFDGDTAPGSTVTATAEIVVLDGSTFLDVEWHQLFGTPAVITETGMNTAEIDLGAITEYKAQLFENLYQPPIDLDDLPPNVPIPPGDLPSGLQNRFQIVGVNPWALEEGGLVEIEAEVTTSSGAYHGEGEVHSSLPWIPALSINMVGVDTPVLLHAKEQASYNWLFSSTPPGSTAVLTDATTRTPEFTPDLPGEYVVQITDIGGGGIVQLSVWAGNYRGVIEGANPDGTHVVEASCTACHNDMIAQDKFTPWNQTGHAYIFVQNLSRSYYGPQCFACHTVGDDGGSNNGIEDQPDYEAFLASGLIGSGDWLGVLSGYPDVARRANIQCENCHGPQDGNPGVFSPAHIQVEPRVTISSDGCATCHGEPLRHARFQQWQLSGHANYELAIDESESGSCSRCHTGNGFLAWLPILTGDVPGDPTASIPVTWTPDEAHPQTCVVCHDPHAIGTVSGVETDATVRISGYTPPLIAGFQAFGVGRGAICLTCHNSRRGLRNDDTFSEHYQTSEASRGPHGSAQADVMMGENAYLVTTGNRGNHSFLTDSCVACHMVNTPPPDQLAYNGGGTNHTFYAGTDICADCHGEGYSADAIQAGVHETLDVLQELIEDALYDLLDEQIGLGNSIDFNGELMLTSMVGVEDITFTEYHGRQALGITVSGTEYGPYRVNDIDVLDATPVVIGQLYDFAAPELVKSGWNWGLIHNDESLGIHNPTYAYNVLTAGIEALGGAVPLAPPEWLTP
ncbi:MAG: hypothetical protein GY715_15765 [Planctomycetes bacterium]|nr:hypothetical protein [Planctomycetota bacterium]